VTEQLYEVALPGHRSALVEGAEFTARIGGREKPTRLRFHHARLTPKGYELTGWDGRMMRTVHAERVVTIHRKDKVSKGASAPPPARKRAR
jgi:hypothetical protein